VFAPPTPRGLPWTAGAATTLAKKLRHVFHIDIETHIERGALKVMPKSLAALAR